ncbi:uncharacterized protein LOC132195912 [Neocloeon triangulifer]|uniref:uncharacterized protein LOC132195912 n=1 Tax=Neocloeon triangulifer TaxID=2078957 RepID=UPI00286ED1EB|nr:uncharacterized protein LOC132195912 [Neocloeon triangulifer]
MSALFDKRTSRVSFVGELPSFPRLSRTGPENRTNSGSWQEWTATAVENVYNNHVYETSVYLLGATLVLVLALVFSPPSYTAFLRSNLLVKLAIRATIVCSFAAFILLRPHFNFSVDLLALTAMLLATSVELSWVCRQSSLGSYSVALLMCTLMVVGVNQGALASKPNLIVLAGLTVVLLLLVTNLNFITAIIGSTNAVNLFIYSLSTALATLNIMGLSVLIGDAQSHPFEINDMVSCGAYMYLMIVFLFANILLFTETLQNI